MQHKKSQKSRRKYDVSFKQEVVSIIAAGRSVADIAHSLDIGENIIYRWRRQALGLTNVASSEPAPPSQVSLSEHLALQKQLRELEMERDILKKALGIFSRSQ
ncbi:transposase [Telluribacter sp. SYSU D00476]|uniref:transposase n=1 Tax=Telluribacter sp. SYSU D00476 TaxID=2811430 RepID=UPI001FF6F20E|nr:transposase [Telluribacter sp. SYSU D00476]